MKIIKWKSIFLLIFFVNIIVSVLICEASEQQKDCYVWNTVYGDGVDKDLFQKDIQGIWRCSVSKDPSDSFEPLEFTAEYEDGWMIYTAVNGNSYEAQVVSVSRNNKGYFIRLWRSDEVRFCYQSDEACTTLWFYNGWDIDEDNFFELYSMKKEGIDTEIQLKEEGDSPEEAFAKYIDETWSSPSNAYAAYDINNNGIREILIRTGIGDNTSCAVCSYDQSQKGVSFKGWLDFNSYYGLNYSPRYNAIVTFTRTSDSGTYHFYSLGEADIQWLFDVGWFDAKGEQYYRHYSYTGPSDRRDLGSYNWEDKDAEETVASAFNDEYIDDLQIIEFVSATEMYKWNDEYRVLLPEEYELPVIDRISSFHFQSDAEAYFEAYHPRRWGGDVGDSELKQYIIDEMDDALKEYHDDLDESFGCTGWMYTYEIKEEHLYSETDYSYDLEEIQEEINNDYDFSPEAVRNVEVEYTFTTVDGRIITKYSWEYIIFLEDARWYYYRRAEK